MVDALAGTYDGGVGYLTSDPADPLLTDPPAHVHGYFVGRGAVRTHVLNNLRAGVVAMTMPDLGTLYVKRSAHVGHYAYIHHSPVSMHMIYREDAFDHFDSILCVGPHHPVEVRERESLAGLPAKQLFEHGYGPFDALDRLGR